MSETATADQAFLVDINLVSTFTEALAGQVRRWSQECQRFLEWQRLYVLAPQADEPLRARHEAALRRLLGLGRMLNAATSDAEFMDRRAAELVKARLAQLQESWELTHTRMTPTEGKALLATSFDL